MTSQRSKRIRKKLKSFPEAIWSIRITENAKKKKSFPVVNEIKRGSTSVLKIKKKKPKRIRHKEVYAQHASEDEGVIRGDGGSSLPRQQNNK